MRAADLRRCRVRLRVVQALLLVTFLALTARSAQLSLFDPRAAKRAQAQVLSVLRLAPERGAVVDRRGVALALSTDAPSVYAVPHAVQDEDATVAALRRVLDTDPKRLRRRLRSRQPFVYLARWVEPSRAEAVRALRLPGVGVVEEPRRTYPYRRAAATLIGFANIDGEGVRGVEQMEDTWLRGAARRVPVERDARGHLLVGPGLAPEEAAGGDVALTLDLAFQADAERALEEAVEATGARGGFALCLDARSGDLLALAERPGFDPNRFRSVPYTDTRSRVFLDALEPGSTLKLFLVAAALEAQVVTADAVIDLEGGRLRVPGKTIEDLHPREVLDVRGILRVSSNVGAVKIAQRLGPAATFHALERFGFGAPTESGFPDESAGVIRPWQGWRPVDHATIAFGQGIAVTPIQLGAALAALANQGMWRPPRLVLARREPGGHFEREAPPAAARRVVSSKTARALLAMLEDVVTEEGTGTRAALEGVRVAGKTGTAQKLDRDAGAYSESRFVAWFAGAAPADAPRIVVVVGLDEPRRPHHTGGMAAAPLFARIAAAHLTRLGIPTRPAHELPVTRRAQASPAPRPASGTEATSAPEGARVARSSRPEADPEAARVGPAAKPAAPQGAPAAVARLGRRILLPDFRGLSLEEVRRVAAGTPLVIEPLGEGVAVEQKPEPGTILGGEAQRVRVRFAPAGRES